MSFSRLPYKEVDVFTKKPFSGNPLAVIFDADGLSTSKMHEVTKWTNFSEAVFFLKPTLPDADYKIRIFSPKGELPFAGHPTIGSAYAAIESGLVDVDDIIRNRAGILHQECNIGLVELIVERSSTEVSKLTGHDVFISFKVPTAKYEEISEKDKELFIESLNIDKLDLNLFKLLKINVGPSWVVCLFDSPERILSITPDFNRLTDISKKLDAEGLICFSFYSGSEDKYEVRTFAPAAGILEDPVCGSGNAAISCFLDRVLDIHGVKNGTQGQKLGREGIIKLSVSKGSLNNYVGGQAITVVDGSIVV